MNPIKIGYIFPGQASQYKGMGKSLYDNFTEVREIYSLANDILKFDVTKLSFEGPEDELTQTQNTQPAIFIHSIAALTLLRNYQIVHHIAAGHSLGEYSALVSAGAISFEDALRLVRLRGELMHRCGIETPGTMAAIVGLSIQKIDEICKIAQSIGIVCPANFNSPDQIAVSGEIKAVEKVMELATAEGAKTAVRLKVGGAFHSPLMKNAYKGLSNALDKLKINNATIPVVANFSAEPVINSESIRNALKVQLLNPVRWEASMHYMIEYGCNIFVEVGPGKVLSGLMRRINKNVVVLNVDDTASLNKTIEQLKQ